MGQTYNLYCDESCHLEHDKQRAMVLGAVWCPEDKVRAVATRLREIKARHELRPGFELKWTKVSPAKVRFYLDLVDYFFDDDDLRFRALIVPNKSLLLHKEFLQEHDTWYYKMLFLLIKAILSPQDTYHVYLDIKDTRSAAKVRKLHEVLKTAVLDWSPNIVQRVQNVRSHEDAIYAQFKADFIDRTPVFRGSPLSLKRHPLLAGKEATFWHLTSEGKVENEPPPDFRRCERIAWVAAIITNADDPAVKVWENERSGERRVLLWLEPHAYLVVLAVRRGYTLPWTAYPVPHEHTKRKLRAEYETYKKLEPPL
jgi:hypothetical protein